MSRSAPDVPRIVVRPLAARMTGVARDVAIAAPAGDEAVTITRSRRPASRRLTS